MFSTVFKEEKKYIDDFSSEGFFKSIKYSFLDRLSPDPEGGECKEYFESACTTRYIEKVCSLFYFLRKHSNLHFVFSRALEILLATLLVRDFQKFT